MSKILKVQITAHLMLLILASGDKFVPDVFIIGEELLLIRSTLVSSKMSNEFLIIQLMLKTEARCSFKHFPRFNNYNEIIFKSFM